MRTPEDAPSALHDVAAQQELLVSAAQCEEHGIGAHRRARLVAAGRWSRPTRGVFEITPPAAAPAVAPEAHDARRRRAAWLALLALGPAAVAVGPCALALLDVPGLPARITPEAALPGGRFGRERDGIVARGFDDGMRCVVVGGRLVAAPEWAVAQAVPELPRRHGLAVLDAVLRLGLLARFRLERAHDVARGRRGVASRHDLWELADARSESPLESFARLDCVEAGVPPDALQVEVHDAVGRFVARGDLGWRIPGGRWLVVEVDGAQVHGPDALAHDLRRQNALLAAGAELLRFSADDLRTPGEVGRAVAVRLAGLGRAPTDPSARRTQHG